MRGWEEVAKRFGLLAQDAARAGLASAVDLAQVGLLPQQQEYLYAKLRRLLSGTSVGRGWQPCPGDVAAVAIALAYRPGELSGIPLSSGDDADREAWNRYAHAYARLNQAVNGVALELAEQFGGIAEGATLDGRAGQVRRVSEYYPYCVSHRALAAAAGLGWIGRHRLLVTPAFGPAVRLATVFIPGEVTVPATHGRHSWGCGDCRACLDACEVLANAVGQSCVETYREDCLNKIRSLGLAADVCGICVRACASQSARVGQPTGVD